MVHYSYRTNRNRSIPNHSLPKAPMVPFEFVDAQQMGQKKSRYSAFSLRRNPSLYENEQKSDKIVHYRQTVELSQPVPTEGRRRERKQYGIFGIVYRPL